MIETPIEYIEQYLRIPEKMETQAGLCLIRVGRNSGKPNYSVGPKAIPNYGLHFVLEGHIHFSQGNQEYELSQGDLFCIFPGEIYSYRIVNPEVPLRLFWLTLHGELVPSLLARISLGSGNYSVKGVVDAEAFAVLENILSLAATQRFKYTELHLMRELYRLFSHMSELIRQLENGSDEHNWLRKGIAYINVHFRENIKVSGVAEHVGVNRTHFSRTFRSLMGQTPQAYIDDLKMEEAFNLINRSSLSVSETAASLGYADAYSFTRSYKRKFGVTPTEHRLNHAAFSQMTR